MIAHTGSHRFNKPGATFRLFLVLSVCVMIAATILLRGWPGLPLWAAYLVAANLATFITYSYDKSASIHDLRRVPESLLHLLAALGGSPAALVAQSALRHKTIKRSFRLGFWAIFIVQILLVTCWLCYAKPWKA